MRGLERLVVLVACACVPGLGAGAGVTTLRLRSSNEIIDKNEKESAASSTTSNSEANESSSASKLDTNENVAYELTGTKEDLVEYSNVTKSVNQRFPHAVLFGGTCGGTIISPTWILTAGHCTLFTTGSQILAGTSNSGDGSGLTRQVKRLELHPKFSVGPYWLDAKTFHIKQVAATWDFLLVELEEALPLDGKTMAAAVISEQPYIPPDLQVGYAGYGAAHHGEVMRSEMHGMELEVQPDATCARALVQYEPQTMLCTRGRPPRFDSACNGDSGSGLVANGQLYGVASWVEEDALRCFNGALVVFARVSSVREWIRQVTSI